MTTTPKDIKLLSASEVRNQHFLIQQNFVQQDFQKILEQVLRNLDTALESIMTNHLLILLPRILQDSCQIGKNIDLKTCDLLSGRKKIYDYGCS